MKTIRMTLTAAVALVMMLTALPTATQAGGSIQIGGRIQISSRQNDDLQVWIWPDRGEGSEYFPGDRIYMNVEVTRDCFLILYDIDTRGNLRILFPYDAWDNNFVSAGDVIRFPRAWDGYDWTVDGPAGIEYVQAIASEFPISPPDWPVYIRSVNHGGAICPDRELRDFRAGSDHLDYIRVVNRKITGRFWDYCATDIASFYVSRPYHTIYTPRDPWPDIFYGDIYIAWPIGGRIYIDGVFIGIAPLWIPRHVHYGDHVIVCRDHDRVVRTQKVHYYAKKDFRHDGPRYRDGAVERNGQVKTAKRGGAAKFKDEGRVTTKPRVVNDWPTKDSDRGKTKFEPPKVETRTDVSKTRTKVEVKNQSTKPSTGSTQSTKSTVTRSKTVTESSKPVSKVETPAPVKKKSSGVSGFISTVAKSVSKATTSSDTRVTSKSASSPEKSKEVKVKSSNSKTKQTSVEKSPIKTTGKKR